MSTVTDPKTGKKTVHRYVVRKSKGRGLQSGQTKKLTLKKYNPITRRHEEYSETKYK